MRLRTRLIVSYAASVAVLIFAVAWVTNVLVTRSFLTFAQSNITTESQLIIGSLTDQYDANTGGFRLLPLQALGMHFVHQGYIVTITDSHNNVLWDARTCDMKQCQTVIAEIETRLAASGGKGALQKRSYPLTYNGSPIGTVVIETFAPYFYTETETALLTTLNRVLTVTAVALFLLIVAVSIAVATSISVPIRRVGVVARAIASGRLDARIDHRFKTRELDELAQDIDQLGVALTERQHEASRLSSDIAHELRTPLTALQGNLEAMMDGVWEPTPVRLASAHEEVVRLSGLVAGLGQISLLEQERLVLVKTTFDLHDLLESVIAMFGSSAELAGVELTLDAPSVMISADRDKLKQVFINLVGNALAHTATGVVSVGVTRTLETVRVTVKDTGSGIAEDDIEHIFERFYRADKSRNRQTGGTGIGLAVAKAIVEAHGGTIGVRSIVDVGSDFTVELPAG